MNSELASHCQKASPLNPLEAVSAHSSLPAFITTIPHPSAIQVSGHGFTRAAKTQNNGPSFLPEAVAQRKRSDITIALAKIPAA